MTKKRDRYRYNLCETYPSVSFPICAHHKELRCKSDQVHLNKAECNICKKYYNRKQIAKLKTLDQATQRMITKKRNSWSLPGHDNGMTTQKRYLYFCDHSPKKWVVLWPLVWFGYNLNSKPVKTAKDLSDALLDHALATMKNAPWVFRKANDSEEKKDILAMWKLMICDMERIKRYQICKSNPIPNSTRLIPVFLGKTKKLPVINFSKLCIDSKTRRDKHRGTRRQKTQSK